MENKVTLGYWKIRGLAEKIRLFMEYLKVPYDQKFFTPENRDQWFNTMKPQFLKKNPAANLPYLIDGEKIICQTNAILVYLCHKANRVDLLGQSSDDQVQIATVMGVYQDMARGYSTHIYGQKQYQEFKQQAYNGMKAHLTKLSGLLGQRDWFCSKLSYADVILGDFFNVCSLFHENFAVDYPTLKKHQERVWNLQGVKQYVSSERFHQRPVNYLPYAKWA